ncbi:MAG: SulP family inorganic anion transporter [Cyanobacteria bacterium HKST-UBA04]|nr:SulP family inorganic anion transporter [Cyanobacteria bacterium HKST-UBA04]
MKQRLAQLKRAAGTDFLASLVVFFVAIPLCLGVALACGVPPVAGLLSGIIGGLVVGLFTGCPLMVSGPAAGLIAIVWQIIQAHGVSSFGLIVFMAGLVQVAFGVFKAGRWFRAVSPAVIYGMLAGIGILIFASQLHVMADAPPNGSALMNLATLPALYNSLPIRSEALGDIQAAFLGLMTIGTIVFWQKVPKPFNVIPGALVGVLVATVIAQTGGLVVHYVSVPNNLFADIDWLHWTEVGLLAQGGVWVSILSLAFVASAETLLTCTAVDKMHGEEKTNYNKEVLAQGVGNVVAGIFGALPVCGVIVRSIANIQAGAKTNLATLMHGAWILLFIAVLPWVLDLIPVSSLAAILVYTGWRLINFQTIKDLVRAGNNEILIYALTVVTIVTFDLLTGIVVGFAASAIKLMLTLNHFDITLKEETEDGHHRTIIDLYGSATFVILPDIADVLEAIEPGREVHIFVSHLNYIDHACLELLTNWKESYTDNGGEVVISWDHIIHRYQEPAITRIVKQVKEQRSEATSS